MLLPLLNRVKKWAGPLWATMFVCCAVVGCSNSDFGIVEGTVKLDGQPLAEADVAFQPEKGSPSYGATNAQGQYKLMFTGKQAGAQVGAHTIRVSTARSVGIDDSRTKLPERVPPQYNIDSKEVREVRSGRQKIDFEFVSTGK